LKIHSFIHQWHYSFLLDHGLFFSFLTFFTQTVGLLGRGISPSQGRYLRTGQHKHKINAHADIHAFSEIRTHDPSVRAKEDISCLRPRGHCDRRLEDYHNYISVNTVTRLQAGYPENRGQIPCREGGTSSSHPHRLWNPSSFLGYGQRRLVPRC
jgi:hypothetical protein